MLDPGGIQHHILRGADPNKDQTYFLAMMQPHQVRIAQFPIGHLLKPELRDLAREFWLKTAEKKDSQGICFIGQVKMEDFLRAFRAGQAGSDREPRRQGAGRASRPASLHAWPEKGHRRGQSAAQTGLCGRGQTSAEQRTGDRHRESRHATALGAKSTLQSISTTGEPLDVARSLNAQPRYRCPAGLASFTPVGDGRATLEYRRAAARAHARPDLRTLRRRAAARRCCL
jgi:tRNA-specific 2-thiouridylase